MALSSFGEAIVATWEEMKPNSMPLLQGEVISRLDRECSRRLKAVLCKPIGVVCARGQLCREQGPGSSMVSLVVKQELVIRIETLMMSVKDQFRQRFAYVRTIESCSGQNSN